MGLEQIKVELQEKMGNDRSIAMAAWTSSIDKSRAEERPENDITKVIKMLAEGGHGVPFESVVLRFWIRMPLFCDRQLMTHRVASHSGMSGRYRTMPNDHYIIPEDVLELMNKVANDCSQGKQLVSNLEFMSDASISAYSDMMYFAKKSKDVGTITNDEYKRIREIARGVMPQSAMTERVTIMNLRSFANFYRLRSDSHAQPEIQQVAKLMMQEVKESNICPIALEELEKVGWKI